MGRSVLLAAAAFLLLVAQAFAQTASTSGSTPATSGQQGSSVTTGAGTGSVPTTGTGSTASGASGTTSSPPAQPVPYSDAEFPLWLRDLHRGEAIMVGAFPFTLLLSSLSYQLYRYAANQFQAAYSPGLFGSTTTPLSKPEQIGVLLGGVSLAAVVALVDFVLGLLEPAPPATGVSSS